MSKEQQQQPDSAPAAAAAKPKVENITQRLAEAQKALLMYDKESVKLTGEKYQDYLAMINESQKNPEVQDKEGNDLAAVKAKWEEVTKARVAGRQALEKAILEILNPALSEGDDERTKRLAEIQQRSEAACLEKPDLTLSRFKKPQLEKAIDQLGGQATKPFKESAKL